MHEAFSDFIRHGRALAEQKGLNWEFDLDDKGRAFPGWNLTEIAGGIPPAFHLRDLGQDNKILQFLNKELAEEGSPPLPKTQLGKNWQHLIKAAICDQLLIRRNSPNHVQNNVSRPLKVLATVAGETEPWNVTVDIVQEAIEIAKRSQPSGMLAEGVFGVTKTVFDANHLAIACPIYSLISVSRRVLPSRRSRAVKSKEQLLDELEERKRGERLPEKRAFWELIRIIFTEQPKSFMDVLRFAAIKTMVVTGLRVGEAVLLPVDWKRNRDYYDPSGRPAGELGGYSRSLMLRHFAEKQQSEQSNSTILFEATQPIPEMFAEILTESLDEVARITEPLRQTLRAQVESGRILPWYEKCDLVPAIELYTRLTGNPFWLRMNDDVSSAYVKRYRNGFNPEILNELAKLQTDQFTCPAESSYLDPALYVFYNRLSTKESAPRFRYASGDEYRDGMKNWPEVYLRVGEVEEYLEKFLTTKLPDTKPLRLQTSELQSWELLFLSPKRSLAEERNDGITDITRYFSVGMPGLGLLTEVLGIDKGNRKTIFEVYGTTEEDRNLGLKSHSLRHLQNTELFRLGVADTIITKRFNRKSVAQSYDYDHRSLAEQLDSIELPPEVEVSLGSKASTVARLIKTGKANGPFVDSFKRIQLSEGDEAAFEFLKVEADGFHATPYGHCINSFTVDPCPKNLECFAGCCHLTATNLPENQRHLRNLEARLKSALSEISLRPMNSVGKANQIAHATVRLDAVRKLCNTPSGQRVFPDGPDLSLPSPTRSVLDG